MLAAERSDLARVGVVRVLAARRDRDVELHLDERLEVLGVTDDLQIVERQHVVGLRLLHPEGLQLFELVRVLVGDVVGSERSSSVWKSCQRSFSKLLMPLTGPCSVTAFQPSCQMPRLPNIS